MRIESMIIYGPTDNEKMVVELKKKYGSLTALQQKVSMRKCTSPEMVDDYMVWRNLERKGAVLTEIHIWKNAEMVNLLTTRRIELLEQIHKNGGKSIMALAISIKRNYKNVYDDLLVLEKIGLITFRTSGRKKIPVTSTSRILIALGD